MATQSSTKATGRRWTDRLGVRWRSTIAAVLVVSIALTLGGLVLIVVLRQSLINNVDAAASQRAADIAAQIGSDDIEAALPTINASSGEGTLVQVITESGDVVLSSPSLEGEPAITTAQPGPGQTTRQDLTISALDSNDFRVVAVGVQSSRGPVVVVTAQSLADVASTSRTVATLLAVGAPLLLLAVGIATWMAVGRSLTAVDRIRLSVETIGATDLDQRIPVPHAEDEVARLAVTMNAMLDRLDTSASNQRQFVADASHELRSPLASLRASIDVATRSGGDGAWELAAPVMSDEVDRMSVLVADLLLLAKADEGALVVRRQDVDLDDLVATEARRLRSQTDLVVRVDAIPARVVGDPDQLGAVLRNLTDNAVRFARTTITLRLTVAEAGVELAVDDDGPGVAPEDRDRVLERFVRLEDHRARSHGGAGLGLAIVAEIVRAHGGTVTVGQSDLGGAGVVVLLPRQPDQSPSSMR